MRSLSRPHLALPLLLVALAGCTPSGLEPPTPPPSTLDEVSGPSCFSIRECGSDQLICRDPRYPRCGTQLLCDSRFPIRCGECSCFAEPCTATSCAADEQCSPSGCCGPKACFVDAECGGTGARCVDGRCIRRGTCIPLPQ